MSGIKGQFKTRSFVNLMVISSLVGLPVTGISMHLTSQAPFSVSYHAWMSAHNALGLIFAVFVTWHVILNWQAICKHCRKIVTVRNPFSREMLLAISVFSLAALFVSHAFILG